VPTTDDLQWIEVAPDRREGAERPVVLHDHRRRPPAFAESIRSQPAPIPVDYDHAEQGTRAAGWFTGQTQVVADGEENPAGETQDRTSLWAEVKWTPQGADDVKNGVFKRISPEWSQLREEGQEDRAADRRQGVHRGDDHEPPVLPRASARRGTSALGRDAEPPPRR
jgi:hypothetical protein